MSPLTVLAALSDAVVTLLTSIVLLTPNRKIFGFVTIEFSE
jgi:hypothetical protein